MRPIKPSNSNFTYTAPPGIENCEDLHVFRRIHEGSVIISSVWELTPEERDVIARGGNIQLDVWGREHPVVGLQAIGD
jgi:hypothetical protein